MFRNGFIVLSVFGFAAPHRTVRRWRLHGLQGWRGTGNFTVSRSGNRHLQSAESGQPHPSRL